MFLQRISNPAHNNRISDCHSKRSNHRDHSQCFSALPSSSFLTCDSKCIDRSGLCSPSKLISPITPVEPIKITNRKYGIRKDPPPYSDTLVGNIQILPIPTAEPMQAQINPHLLLNDSLLFIPHSLIRALLCTEHLSGINFVIRCCCTDFFIPFLRIYILYRN